MRYEFEKYEQFNRMNSSNAKKLSKNSAIQIRRLWKEKELACEQWWALFVSYRNRREEKGTVNDIFGDVRNCEIYVTNPGALIKVFDDVNGGASVEADGTQNTLNLNSKVVKEIKAKIESLGGEVLDSDDEDCDECTRYKVRVNGSVNWYTYRYIMNNL